MTPMDKHTLLLAAFGLMLAAGPVADDGAAREGGRRKRSSDMGLSGFPELFNFVLLRACLMYRSDQL